MNIGNGRSCCLGFWLPGRNSLRLMEHLIMLLSSSPALYPAVVQHAASLSSRRDPNATPVPKLACQVQVVVVQSNSMEQSFGGRAGRIS